MGLWARSWIATGVTVAVGVVALLYVEVGQLLLDMLSNNSSGPFSGVGDQVSTLLPPVLAALVLGIWIWVIAGEFQRQPDQRRPRP